MLVMGDALAIALIRERNFRPEDYAVFHPGGSLGRRLLTRVRDVMRKDIPCVEPTATLGDVIIRISDARLGIAAIVEQGRLTGVITDGDVRRAMTKYKENFSISKPGRSCRAVRRPFRPTPGSRRPRR